MPIPKILVFAGSIRTGSFNARLAALAAKEIARAEAEVTRISLLDFRCRFMTATMKRAPARRRTR